VATCGIIWELDEKNNQKNAENSKTHPPHKKKNPQPIGCMLHHLIGGAKFLFVHLFVTVDYQG
jgi:hypothetical protein